MPDTPPTRREIDGLIKAIEKLDSTIEGFPDRMDTRYPRKEVFAGEIARITDRFAGEIALVAETLRGIGDRVERVEKFRDYVFYGLLGSALTGLGGVSLWTVVAR